MPTNLNALAANSNRTRKVSIKVHNRTPFPIKIYRRNSKGKEIFCNLLYGYSQYVQRARKDTELVARLAADEQPLKRLKLTNRSQTLHLNTDLLRSQKTDSPVQPIRIQSPVHGCQLLLIDEQGKRQPLHAKSLRQGEELLLELPEGAMVTAMDPKQRVHYFWLLVTQAGEANVMAQSFRTGTGWGIQPEAGELALFIDLGLGKKPGYRPEAAPAEPFWLLLRSDIPDLSALLDGISDHLYSGDKIYQPGATPAKPATLEQVRMQSRQHRKGSPVILKAVTGSGIQARLYQQPDYRGDSCELGEAEMPHRQQWRSLLLESAAEAVHSGLRVLTSLSEDYRENGRGKLVKLSRFRTTLIGTPGSDQPLEISCWEPDTEIEVEGKRYRIGPDRSVSLPPNEMGRLVISMDADEAGCPELMIRDASMPLGTSLMVNPDQEMHEKIAKLPKGELHRSGLAGKKQDAKSVDQVQIALQNLSRSVLNSHSESRAGVQSRVSIDARQMADAHWSLELDEKSGQALYKPLQAAEAQQINRSRSTKIQVDKNGLAQGFKIGKVFKKATSVVVSSVETAGKESAKGLGDVANSVAQGAESAANSVANEAVKFGDSIEDAAQVVGKGFEVTIHFIDKTAIQFIARGAKQLATAIRSLVELIEIEMNKFMEWLSFLFDWKDIRHTQKVLQRAIEDVLKQSQKGLKSARKEVNGAFDSLRNNLKQQKAYQPKSLTQAEEAQESSPTHDSGNEKLEWFMDLLTSKSRGKKLHGEGDVEDIPAKLIAAAGDNSEVLKAFEQDFTKLGGALEKGDVQGILEAFGSFAIDMADLVLGAAQGVIDAIFALLETVVDLLFDLLTNEIKIPFISQLYKEVIGDKMSVLSLATLLLAIPLTVTAKLATGRAPFRKVKTLASSGQLEVDKAYMLGVLDIVSGISSAWNTMQAGGATGDISKPTSSGRPGRVKTAFNIGKLILKSCMMFYYIYSANLMKSDAGYRIVYWFGMIRCYVAMLSLFFTFKTGSSETVGIDVAADACYGMIKLLGGSIEIAEGHETEGVIIILQGSGMIIELAGFTKNPLIWGVASIVSLNVIWAAAVLQFYRAAKM